MIGISPILNHQPHIFRTRATYNSVNQLQTSTDAHGNITNYSFDARNRLLSLTKEGGWQRFNGNGSPISPSQAHGHNGEKLGAEKLIDAQRIIDRYEKNVAPEWMTKIIVDEQNKIETFARSAVLIR
jgi:hypothetical protein